MSLFRSNRCYNGGSRHNLEAAYDRQYGTGGSFKGATSAEQVRALRIKLKVYKGHVCKWCGKTFNQEAVE